MVLGALVWDNLKPVAIERHFRRFGFIAMVQVPLVFILSMKNNPCSLLGRGYERVNFLHRLVGQSHLLSHSLSRLGYISYDQY